MIGVKSRGRLGNQMFQYAFLHAYAKKHGVEVFIDEFGALEYFQFTDRFRFKNRINRWIAGLTLARAKLCIKQYDNETGFRQQDYDRLFDRAIHVGYFQSEAYFEHCRTEIKELFQIRQSFAIQPQSSPYLAIHMRFGDYSNLNSPNLGKDVSLPESYFVQSIQKLRAKVTKIIVLSDEPERAKKMLSDLPNIEFYAGSEIEDFQTLMFANYLIISNSTFAWWAAYLNKNAIEIIAPEFWMGINNKKTYPVDIYRNLNWTIGPIE